MPTLAFPVLAGGRHVRQGQLGRVTGAVFSDWHLLQVRATLQQALVVALRHGRH